MLPFCFNPAYWEELISWTGDQEKGTLQRGEGHPFAAPASEHRPAKYKKLYWECYWTKSTWTVPSETLKRQVIFVLKPPGITTKRDMISPHLPKHLDMCGWLSASVNLTSQVVT
jgi:hypothetical protein